MLFGTSLVALVGTAEHKESSPRTVKLYNTRSETEICHLNFKSTVRNIKMNKSRLIVALDRKMHIFDLKTMKRINEIETCLNPCGVFDLCCDEDNCLVAYPHKNTARILHGVSSGSSSSITGTTATTTTNTAGVMTAMTAGASAMSKSDLGLDYNNGDHFDNRSFVEDNGNFGRLYAATRDSPSPHVSSTSAPTKVVESQGKIGIMDAFNLQVRTIIDAHDSPIQALAFNPEGNLLATASITGTVIRVFTIPIGKHKHSFRRGSLQTKIQSLAFNHTSTLLCCSSTSPTIHIFNLTQQFFSSSWYEQTAVAAVNMVSDYLPQTVMNRIEHPRSFAQISLKLESKDIIQCGFHGDHNVVVATQSGYFYRYEIPCDGGQCKLEEEHSLKALKREDEGTTIFAVSQESGTLEEQPGHVPSIAKSNNSNNNINVNGNNNANTNSNSNSNITSNRSMSPSNNTKKNNNKKSESQVTTGQKKSEENTSELTSTEQMEDDLSQPKKSKHKQNTSE
ncbi:hypothetical protein RFI_27205, partial [Reticulomyxa filosa]